MISAKEAFGAVSIVVPAYNAARHIVGTLDSIRTYLNRSGVDGEIIVVDDGSTDDTAALVREYAGEPILLANEGNRGKGYTVRRGMLEATKPWALFMDVDNSTTLDHLDRFAPPAADADVLIASRRLPDSNIVQRQPFFRRISGEAFPFFVRALALPGVRDTQCGFKVFRTPVAREVFTRQRCEGFCFDVEVLLIARRLGHRLTEVAVNWDNPPASTVRVSRDSARMFADLVRISWRHRRGRYQP